MESLKNFIENLKEKIKTAWAEQQESELFLKTKEKYDELPSLAQKGIMAFLAFLLLLVIFWWPLSNFFDSSDLSSKFDEERLTLKELLRIERETPMGAQGNPPPPSSLKSQFDDKIANAGIKPDQIKDQSEMPPQAVGLAQQLGFQYRIEHLTIRQAVDLSYDLEHVDSHLHIAGLDMLAEPQDPHFYDVGIKIVTFAPKLAEAGAPGKGIVDAIKKKNAGAGGGKDRINMLSKILDPLLNIVRFHKKELALLLGLYIFFIYLFFPFNDLGDLVSAKISEQTQGQVSLDFDNLNLSLIPQPGVSLSKVKIETPYTPSLAVDSLFVSPSITGLLSFKPGVNMEARGFLDGNIDLSAGLGDKTQTTPSHRKQKISLDLNHINLGMISTIASLPLKFEGLLSGNVDSDIDPEFAEQPSGSVELKAEKAILPEGNISTPFGPIGLPRVSLGEINLEGQSDKGSVEISKFVAGHPGGDLYANVTGHLDLKVIKAGPTMQPQMGAYDLIVHLQIGDALRQKLGAFLGILSNYETTNNVYAFRATGPNSFTPPNLTRLGQ